MSQVTASDAKSGKYGKQRYFFPPAVLIFVLCTTFTLFASLVSAHVASRITRHVERGGYSRHFPVAIFQLRSNNHRDWIFLQFVLGRFLSDPGVPGVRSMGPVVSHSLTFLKLN